MRLRVGFTGGGGITETHARAARDCPDLEIAGTPPVGDGHEGRRSLAVVEAVSAAAKDGGREVT